MNISEFLNNPDNIVPPDFLKKYKPKSKPDPPRTYTNGYHTANDLPTYEEVAAALDALPAHFGPNSYDIWLSVLMSVHAALGDAGKTLCIAKWPEDAAEIEKKWGSFDGGGGVTHRTLFRLAYDNGLEKPRKTQDVTDETLPTLLDPDIIADIIAGKFTRPEYFTDLGNAWRFAYMHCDDVRYVEAWGWLVWTGQRWQVDKTGEIMRRAKETALSLIDIADTAHEKASTAEKEAREAEKEKAKDAEHKQRNAAALRKEAKSIHNWALASQGLGHLKAMVTLAQSEFPIPADENEFDHAPWLLNARNGTIDLHTGRLQPHNRHDLLTTVAPVEYDPHAECPKWLAFLDRILDKNPNLIGFLQRVLGYSLTGDVGEQKLFFAWGMGANGKSTLFTTVLSMLGDDYAGQAAPDLLTVNKDRHPTEVADLRGKRMIASIEVDDGKRLAEGLVKQLTGGDKIKARHMRQDFFQFNPTHKLFLVANHKPVIKGTDMAIWRRICLIPFDVIIPEKERNPALLQELIAELPGILAWCVQGCLAWQNQGLDVPDEVIAATDAYKEESDILGAFLEECTVKLTSARVNASKLFFAYREWSGDARMTQTRFGKLMTDRGMEKDKNYLGVFYTGIGLVEREAEDGENNTDTDDAVDQLGL